MPDLWEITRELGTSGALTPLTAALGESPVLSAGTTGHLATSPAGAAGSARSSGTALEPRPAQHGGQLAVQAAQQRWWAELGGGPALR